MYHTLALGTGSAERRPTSEISQEALAGRDSVEPLSLSTAKALPIGILRVLRGLSRSGLLRLELSNLAWALGFLEAHFEVRIATGCFVPCDLANI